MKSVPGVSDRCMSVLGPKALPGDGDARLKHVSTGSLVSPIDLFVPMTGRVRLQREFHACLRAECLDEQCFCPMRFTRAIEAERLECNTELPNRSVAKLTRKEKRGSGTEMVNAKVELRARRVESWFLIWADGNASCARFCRLTRA